MNKRNEQLQAMSFEQLHARSVEFHGHSCPGLIIGIKAAMYVMELFHEAFSEDEEFVCVAENDACGVDAIQSILGCSVGKGNLLFRMRENMHTHFIAERHDRVPDWCCDRLSI